MKTVWFVTGASKGLGLSLVKKLLGQGHRVAATSRNENELIKAVGPASDAFLPISMQLLDEANVAQGIQKAIAQFGRIDVLVNNAGYGLVGALEELSDAEARANFDVNVFGALNVIRQVLPQLRQQQSGHIFNIASIGGFAGGFPGFGIYCATKFAMHGFTEALATEVSPFNIKATVVSPGYFRTNFLSSGSLITPKNEMEEYRNVREVQDIHQQDYNRNQPGDPDKAADVMIAVAAQKDPVLHLFLGADAYNMADVKMKMVQENLDKVRAMATATGFAEVEA